MGRSVSLILVTPDGHLIGRLPPLEFECPYWPEAADVCAAAAERFGIEVVVLRLLRSERSEPPGGHLTCLAETPSDPALCRGFTGPVSAEDAERATSSQPLRMPWAEIGGPAASLAWVGSTLGLDRATLRAVQQRTWNLSSLWRLEPVGDIREQLWLKEVPGFFRHESAVLRWLNSAVPGSAPSLLAADDEGRSLMAHLPGEDLYSAPLPLRRAISEQLHAIQVASTDAVEELILRGVPDLRGGKLAATIRDRLGSLAVTKPGVAVLLRRLDESIEQLNGCGLPDVLVHGDSHPGNARGGPQGVALLDWGDAFIGNPALDLFRMVDGLAQEEAAPFISEWCANWKRHAPQADPAQALSIVRFIDALRAAGVYAHFLREIEPSEWPYHQADVPRCLAQAGALARVQ